MGPVAPFMGMGAYSTGRFISAMYITLSMDSLVHTMGEVGSQYRINRGFCTSLSTPPRATAAISTTFLVDSRSAVITTWGLEL